MPISNEKLRSVYAALQNGGYEQDYNTFLHGFAGNENYENRRKVYNLLRDNGADIGNTYEDFMSRLQSDAGGQDYTYNPDNVTAKTRPAKEEKQERPYLTTQAVEDDGNDAPTFADYMKGMRAIQAGQVQTDAAVRRANKAVEYGKQHLGLDVKPAVIGENRNVEKETRFNAETGKAEDTYLTSVGGEYTTRADAEQEQKQIDLAHRYKELQEGLEAEKKKVYADIDAEIDRLREQEASLGKAKNSASMAEQGKEQARATIARKIASLEEKKKHFDREQDYAEQKFLYENAGIKEQFAEEKEKADERVEEMRKDDKFLGALNTIYPYLPGKLKLGAQGAAYVEDVVRRWANPEYGQARATQEKLTEAGNTVNQALRKDETSWYGNLLRGAWDSASSLRTWDFGVNDLTDARNIAGLMEKADRIAEAEKKGEKPTESLTASEQQMLDALALTSTLESNFSDHVPMAYRVGQSVPESSAFAASIALNPASGLGRAAEKAAVRSLVGRVVANGATLSKYGKWGVRAMGMAARVGGDALEALSTTLTTGLPRTLEGMYGQKAGTAVGKFDENGRIVFDRVDDREKSSAKAFGKATWNQFVENQSEMVGEYFNPIGNFVARSTKDIRFAREAVELLLGADHKGKMNFLNTFRKRAHIGGLMGEYAEEVYGNMLNTVPWGDMNWTGGVFRPERADFSSDKEYNDAMEKWRGSVFNAETNVETFLSVAAMMAPMGALEAGGKYMNAYTAKKQLNISIDNLGKMIGQEKTATLVDALRNAESLADMSKIYTTAVQDGTVTDAKQAKALLDVAGRMVAQQSIDTSETVSSASEDRFTRDFKNAYAAGHEMKVEDRHKAAREYDAAQEACDNMFGSSITESLMNMSLEEFQRLEQTMTPEQKRVAEEFYLQTTRMYGIRRSVEEAVDEDVAKHGNTLRNMADEQGSVWRGDALGPNEYIVPSSLQKEGNTCVVRDMETSVLRMIPRDQAGDITSTSMEEELQGLRERLGREAENQCLWSLNHNVRTVEPQAGETVVTGTDEQGSPVRMRVVSIDEEGNASLLPVRVNGETGQEEAVSGTPTVMSTYKLLEAQDDYYDGLDQAARESQRAQQTHDAALVQDGQAEQTTDPVVPISGTREAITRELDSTDEGRDARLLVDNWRANDDAETVHEQIDGVDDSQWDAEMKQRLHEYVDAPMQAEETNSYTKGEIVLSDEVDEKGRPFVEAEDGTTVFGKITDNSGLSAAPIKLSEGFQDKNTGKGYGLIHIEANHGRQIREAGFASVRDFVSYVAANYDPNNIRVGKRRSDGSMTFLIQVTDTHDNTLFVELSKDGSYWNVNSGGVFRRGYSDKKETVAKTEPKQPNNAVSSGSSLSANDNTGISYAEPNGEPTVSSDKFTPVSSDGKTKTGENAEGKELPRDKDGNLIYDQVPVKDTVEDLYDGNMDDQEVTEFVRLQADEAEKALRKAEGKTPKMTTNKAKNLEAKRKWEAAVREAQRKVDYWHSVAQEIDRLTSDEGTRSADAAQTGETALSGETLAARVLAGSKIQPESFRRETGYGPEEQKRYVGLISNDGQTIDHLAEELVDLDNTENNGGFFAGDTYAAKESILSALQQAGTRGELLELAQGKSTHEGLAEHEEQVRDEYYLSRYGMTYDDYQAYVEQEMPALLRRYNGYDETAFLSAYAEEIERELKARENDRTGEEQGDGRNTKVLPGERTGEPAGVDENAGPRSQGETRDGGSAEEAAVREGAAPESNNTPEEKNDVPGESGSGVQEVWPLSDEKATNLLNRMEENADEMPMLELNPENWKAQFGENGVVSTPVGQVKMGENQIAKLFEKGRSEQFGMIKPTLESPQVIIEVPSEANDNTTERGSSLLFVKTFIQKNGHKIYYFKSVTVRKDGLEVSVSSHYDRPKRIKDALKNGKLLYRFDGGAQTEHHPADVSVTASPKHAQGLSSASKVTPVSADGEAKTKKNSEKEEKTAKAKHDAKEDNQGNPLNADGTLKVEQVSSVDELTDEDFSSPTRNVQLPKLPANVDSALGANGKPVVIKKNILERNAQRHPDITAEQSREILRSALYNPDLYGQNQKTKRPYNWVVINTKDENGKNRVVLLEVNQNKDNVEIVHWHYMEERGIDKIRRQAEREDGQLLMLPSESSEEAGALSSPTRGLSSASKVTPVSADGEAKTEKNEVKEGNSRQADGNQKKKSARFEAGKRLSKEEKREVLSTLRDAYKEKGVPYHIEETPGGREKRVYEPTSDSYVISDITGRPLRYYITLPDGRVAHPSELYPNISDKDVAASAARQELLDRDAEEEVKQSVSVLCDPHVDKSFSVRILEAMQKLPHETRDAGYGLQNAVSYGYKTGVFTSDLSQAVDYVAGQMRRKEAVPAETVVAVKKAVAKCHGMVDGLISALAKTSDDSSPKARKARTGESGTREGNSRLTDGDHEKKMRLAERVAKALGAKLVIVDHMEENGRFTVNRRTGERTITISRDAENPLAFVFGHESLHAVRSRSEEAYQNLRDMVRAAMGEKAWNQEVAKAVKMYQGQKGYNSLGDYEEEVVAEFLGSVLNDQQRMADLARRLDRPVLAAIMDVLRKIRDWFSQDRMTAQERWADDVLEIVERAYAQAAKTGKGRKTESKASLRQSGTDLFEEAQRIKEIEELNRVNKEFNERLAELYQNPNQKNRVLKLGRPGRFLVDGGLTDAEIELEFDRLLRKSKESYENNHPFDVRDIEDLPQALNAPIAVFTNTNGKDNTSVVLTELKKNGKNFIVSVRAAKRNKKGGVKLEVNEITTLFPKDERGIIQWINSGSMSNVDKRKALPWIEALRNHHGTELTQEELSSAAKVVENFEKTSWGEKESSDMASKFSLRNSSDSDLFEEAARQKRKAAAKEIADKYGLDEARLSRYDEGMRLGNSAAASIALRDLRAVYQKEHSEERKALMEREGVNGLVANRRLFAPIEKAIKESFGDVEDLIAERVRQAEEERNLMEAARKRAEEERQKRQARLDELAALSDTEIDRQYADALERGDEALAREMLDEAARRKGYSDAASDYQGVGAWEAPSNPGYDTDQERREASKEDSIDLNVEDMAAGYSNQPMDIFENPRRYSQVLATSKESGRAIQAAIDKIKRGEKDVKVKVYRAVPTSVKEGKLRNGDWVTPNRAYAEMHGDHRLEGKYRLIEDEVPASELWWDSNDVNEWGYDNGKEYRYKNARNNRKLNDLVTRDDNGNIIPPSKRFNSRKADERYSLRDGGTSTDLFAQAKQMREEEERRPYYNPRQRISPVRGEWTKDKILRRLKDIGGSLTGFSQAAKLISEFDSPKELASHMFYHGTAHGYGALKPSITMSDRDVERLGGGGYGEKYWGISVTKSKRIASRFSGTAHGVSIYPIVLAKRAVVKDMPSLQDAADLEDCITDLWAEGVDAVWIGNKDEGEQELCVLNPKAIVNIDNADYYKAFGLGTDKNPLWVIDKRGVEGLYAAANRFQEAKAKRPSVPSKPSRFDDNLELKSETQYEKEMADYEEMMAAYENSIEYKTWKEEERLARKDIKFSLRQPDTSTDIFEKAQRTRSEEETALRDAVTDRMRQAGIEVITDTEAGQRVLDMASGKERMMSAKKKRALETASLGEAPRSLTVVPSADGAKVLKSIDALSAELDNSSTQPKTFIGEAAKALGAKRDNSASEYATFETQNGKVVTIRLSNHNVTVSNFDNRGEEEGISIVITPKPNQGVTNDGKAHVTEFYYNALKLRRADGKPLAEILRSIRQALYSGAFHDTTGLAEVQEVNADEAIRYHKVYHGSGADFDHFDHSHMGEGEGAQAYGWGTYVTEVEGIGRTYAKASSMQHEKVSQITVEHHKNQLSGWERTKQAALDRIRRIEETIKEYEGTPNAEALLETMEKRKSEAQQELEKSSLKIEEEKQWLEDNPYAVPTQHLYTVEIPEDTGENYLEWDKPLSREQIETLREGLAHLMDSTVLPDNFKEKLRRLNNGYAPVVNIVDGSTGRQAYEAISEALLDSYASKFLSSLGFTGIKYPANYQRGGNEDGKQNYVIFNEKDAKITDHVRFFRTAHGEAYGFTVGGKVYLDPRVATAETPIHEYAHLWATALRQRDGKAWLNVVGLMKGTSVWDEVRRAYPELKSDDEVADEVLATYSGRRGAERLREEMRKAMEGKDMFAQAAALQALDRVRKALRDFWHQVARLLGLRFTSAEQVADQVLGDLLEGKNPNEELRPDTPVRVVESEQKHGFKNYKEAKDWAKKNIARTYSSQETGGKGEIRISNAAIDKYLSESAVAKSESKDAHLSVLKVLPDVIRESVDAEQHPDYKKNASGVRDRENGVNPDVTIHRLYGAVRIGDNLYRVKVTLKEDNTSVADPKKAYSYEATKIELLAGQHGENSKEEPSPRYSSNSITAAKLLNGVEKSYGGGKFFADYDKIREQFIGEKGATSLDHAEEVTTRLDNLAVAREMEEAKKDAKTIKMGTGWERGADGKWRYEIADSRASLRHKASRDLFMEARMLRDEERKERRAAIAERRAEAKELYANVLRGDFDAVTLQQINDFIDHSTKPDPYGRTNIRPLSQRLPARALLEVSKGERTGSVDALFSRISESTVPANERTRAEGKRRIEEKKKELLKGWAIATGNWHTDIRDFVDDTKPIGQGKDSTVYYDRDGKSVIKVSHGKENLKKFRPDVDNVALFNAVFPGSRYTILGYGEIDGKFVRFLQQPIVDFTSSTPLTAKERVDYMQRLGFQPMNKEKTAFTNGEIVASDIQGNNIVKDHDGNIRVIDADMRLHTKDVGGQFDYPAVEDDTESRASLREAGTSTDLFAQAEQMRDKAERARQAEEADEDTTTRASLRTKPAPKKTQKVYKLMRLGEDGGLYPLFIGNSDRTEMEAWYDADSPKLEDLKGLPSGVHLVNNETGKAVPLADFKEQHPEFAKLGAKPNAKAIEWATANGYRWIGIEDKAKGQSRYGGEARSYYNYGVNGSGAVSVFAMRPGWHAGSLPTMRQIGKGKEKNLRDRSFVWVEGEIPADIDYNEEAQRNDDKDIPDHIPTDGFYMKATNADKVKSQAGLVGWYVAGAFKANRVMSDAEAREVIDRFNQEHSTDVLYDYDREGGEEFTEADAARVNEQNGVESKASLRRGEAEELNREGEGLITDEEVSLANDPVSRMLGQNRFTEKEQHEFAERRRQRMAEHVEELANRLHLDNVELITDISSLEGKKAKAKGFYNKKSEKITVVIPNHTSVADVEKTLLHEAVAHYGLRKLFGEHFDTFLDNVYNKAHRTVRMEIHRIADEKGLDLHTATEEYLAQLAEQTNFDNAQESGWWLQISNLFMRMLHSIGFEGWGDFTGVSLSDAELRYLLWRSYENLRAPGEYKSITGDTKDTHMQERLGVGEYESKSAHTNAAEELQDGDLFREADGRMSLATMKQKVSDLFKKAEIGEFRGKPQGIGRLSKNGKSYLEKISGESFKDYVDFVLNPSDLNHIRGNHYGQNEKDKGNNIPLTDEDIQNMVDVLYQPDGILYGIDKKDGRKLFFFLKDAGEGMYNLTEVCSTKKGNLTAKSFFKTKKKGIDQRVMEIKQSLLPTSVTYSGEFLSSDAKIPPLFENNEGLGENIVEKASLRRGASGTHNLFQEAKEMRDEEETRFSLRNNNQGSGWSRETMQKAWDSIMSRASFMAKEGYWDYLASVEEFQNLVAKATGRKVSDLENAYQAMLALSSRNANEMKLFDSALALPLQKAVLAVAGAVKDFKTGKGRALAQYLITKHGIERNRDMAVRAALKEQAAKDMDLYAQLLSDWYNEADRIKQHAQANGWTWRQTQEALTQAAETYGADMDADYSGLTGMLTDESDADTISPAEATDRAYRMVETYEGSHDHLADLWQAVHDISEYSLTKQHKSGLVGKEYVDDQHRRYEYYVPLRGFADPTAEDMYGYLDGQRANGGLGSPVKTAKGRTSEAADPLGNLLNVAYRSIASGNKNMALQHFYNLVNGRDTSGLAVTDKMWVENVGTDTNPDWVLAEPQLTDPATGGREMTGEEVQAEMERFNADMEAKRKAGTAKQLTGGKSDPQYRIVNPGHKRSHQVRLNVGGRARVITIAGNPRVALALNGLLNPENSAWPILQRANNFMASAFTNYNVSFGLANLARDTMQSNMRAFIMENPLYWAKFTAKQGLMLGNVANCARMIKMMLDYGAGKQPNGHHERMFKEFLEGGGATGYTMIRSQEEASKFVADLVRDLKNAKRKKLSPMRLFDLFSFLNESTELVNRFIAYETSREMGRTVERSVDDAKEATLNFNRKGAGAKSLTDKEGAKYRLANALNYYSQYGRSFIVFFNAFAQSQRQLYKMMTTHPAKFTAAFFAAPVTVAAVALPVINNLLLPALYGATGGDGDDDDDNYGSYYDELSDWERQHNICIRLPKGHGWIKIPLSAELATPFALGDVTGAAFNGQRDLSASDASVLLDLVTPNNINGNDVGVSLVSFLPSGTQFAGHIAINRDFKGSKLYNDSPFARYQPNWRTATRNTSKSLVALSRGANRLAGGSDERNAEAWYDWKPGYVQEMLTGLAGGWASTALAVSDALLPMHLAGGGTENSFAQNAQALFDRGGIPVVSRFIIPGSGTRNTARAKSDYLNTVKPMMGSIESELSLIKGLTKDAAKDVARTDRLLKDAEKTGDVMTIAEAQKAKQEAETRLREKALEQKEKLNEMMHSDRWKAYRQMLGLTKYIDAMMRVYGNGELPANVTDSIQVANDRARELQ